MYDKIHYKLKKKKKTKDQQDQLLMISCTGEFLNSTLGVGMNKADVKSCVWIFLEKCQAVGYTWYKI